MTMQQVADHLKEMGLEMLPPCVFPVSDTSAVGTVRWKKGESIQGVVIPASHINARWEIDWDYAWEAIKKETTP